jgi:hypothetical protein
MRTVLDALVRQGIPFVIHEDGDDRLAQQLRDALDASVPSGRWLECEGGVISGLFHKP